MLLVSFEPLLDKWAYYLSLHKHTAGLLPTSLHLRGRKGETMEDPPSLGWSAPNRAIVLPYAVGPSEDGYAEFQVARSDGCSSLLKLDPSSFKMANHSATARHRDVVKSERMAEWFRGECGTASESAKAARRVPIVRLQTILDEWLPGQRIAFVKIDAQGYDMHVAMSAGDAISRIGAFELEVTGDRTHMPYKDAERCSDVMANMSARGFRPSNGSWVLNACDNGTFHKPVTFYNTHA